MYCLKYICAVHPAPPAVPHLFVLFICCYEWMWSLVREGPPSIIYGAFICLPSDWTEDGSYSWAADGGRGQAEYCVWGSPPETGKQTHTHTHLLHANLHPALTFPQGCLHSVKVVTMVTGVHGDYHTCQTRLLFSELHFVQRVYVNISHIAAGFLFCPSSAFIH